MVAKLSEVVVNALEDLKANNVVVMDVSDKSDVMDTMILASGTSSRHVKSLAQNVVDEAKKQGFRTLGVEGTESAEWVLVDFGEIVVHVMLPATRDFYDLEKLWSVAPASRTAKKAGDEE